MILSLDKSKLNLFLRLTPSDEFFVAQIVHSLRALCNTKDETAIKRLCSVLKTEELHLLHQCLEIGDGDKIKEGILELLIVCTHQSDEVSSEMVNIVSIQVLLHENLPLYSGQREISL